MDNNNNEVDASFDPDDYTYALPDDAKAWLVKYGITAAEIAHFHICWNKRTDSLTFPVILNDKVVLTSERYFGEELHHPKYVVKGQKNKNTLFITHEKVPQTLVFVEDFVSAIKVARFTGACPLLGSTLPANTLKWAVEKFSKLRVWLDYDKATQSLLEASKLSQYCGDVRSIITTMDPKEYTNNELTHILRRYSCLPS